MYQLPAAVMAQYAVQLNRSRSRFSIHTGRSAENTLCCRHGKLSVRGEEKGEEEHKNVRERDWREGVSCYKLI